MHLNQNMYWGPCGFDSCTNVVLVLHVDCLDWSWSVLLICHYCRYRNPYIVALCAYSFDGPSPCLIYEFMENGSLEDNLLCRVSDPLCIWVNLPDAVPLWENLLHQKQERIWNPKSEQVYKGSANLVGSPVCVHTHQTWNSQVFLAAYVWCDIKK